MRWFEVEKMPDGPRRVMFVNVTGARVRAPSWLPSARARGSKREDQPSLRPPRLPSELVDAIRHELGPAERGPRTRASEMPPANARGPSLLPPPLADGAQARAAVPVAPAPAPAVDPETRAAFERAVELLVEERARVLEQTASQLAELATIIARRVIAHEISQSPEFVLGLVREGLEALGAQDRVVVRLGRVFAEARAGLEQRLSERGARAEVRLDPTLGEHGCVIETELGSVDESIETRIATLLHALKPESSLPDEEPR